MVNYTILKKNNYFYGQLLFLIVLSLFANGLFSYHHFKLGLLYWDHMRLYNLFRDSLHSLNYFGEIAWWNPVSADGFPMYYFSILGNNGLTPIFAVFSTLAWFLGLIGIHITSYHAIYVFFAEIVIPLFFVLVLFFLSRQILQNHIAVFLVIILGCFSPNIIVNLSDFGIEQSAYGIFFVAALLKMIREPEKKTFFLFWFASLVLAISINHLFLYWDVLFIPLFVIMLFLLRDKEHEHSPKEVYSSVPKAYWVLFVFTLFLCMLPMIITYSHGGDILRSTLSQRTYSFLSIKSGNPIEIFSIGTPYIGFSPGRGFFKPTYPYAGYTYLGFLSLPFVFLGCLAGKRIWRYRFLVFLMMGTLVFLLGSYSPLFSLILGWPTPLRAVNHFCDLVFRLGVSFLLILVAGMGLEVLVEHGERFKKILLALVVGTCLFSVGILSNVYQEDLLVSHAFGFLVAVFFFSLVFIARLFVSNKKEKGSKLFILLLFLILIDVSTISFWHVRNIVWKSSYNTREPSIEVIGMNGSPGNVFSETILVLRDVLKLKINKVKTDLLPKIALFDVSVEETGKNVNPGDLDKWEPLDGTIEEKAMSYNSLLLNIESSKEATLFWKDTYFPFWKVQVNGEKGVVKKVFGAFKGVRVPYGKSSVFFYFSPGVLPVFIFLSYLVIVIVWIGLLFLIFKNRKILPMTQEQNITQGVT